MTFPFSARIARLQKLVKGSAGTAILVASNPVAIRSRHEHYPYRPNSDLFYFTGIRDEGVALLIKGGKSSEIVIFAPPPDRFREVWEGKRSDVRKVARVLDARFEQAAAIPERVIRELRGIQVLYSASENGSIGRKVIERLLALPAGGRYHMPREIRDGELLTAKLRSIKDAAEIQAIKEACTIACEALHATLPSIQPGAYEYEIKALLDYYMERTGSAPSFDAIVASGSSAAALHYRRAERQLRNGELLLIDWGCQRHLYASDVTRTMPVNGKFSPIQAELYDVVLETQLACCKEMRVGRKLRAVHDLAGEMLTEGLIRLRVLKGKASKLAKEGAHRQYYPHGIGHSVGLDVHDVAELRALSDETLQNNMVVTVEPGLYFPRPVGRITQPCGVRIEDTVVVRSRGSVNLTDRGFPKERAAIEELLARA